MGQGVYKTDESDLVDFFIDSVISLGFQAPEIKGVGEDWQIRANPAHIQNIRTWIQLIELNPKWSKRLLSSLIIHLSLSGVLIKDTDIFPRDITQLLNSDIGPCSGHNSVPFLEIFLCSSLKLQRSFPEISE